MHKLHKLLCSIPALLCLNVSEPMAQNRPWEFTLPFQQATIQYTITGMENGSETLYITDSGDVRATHQETTSSMMGMTVKSHSIEITTPRWITTYDLTEGTADKVANPKRLYEQAYEELNAEEQKIFESNIKELGPSLMINLNGKTVKDAETILGYSCDKVTIESLSTTYLIHNTDITLRSSSSIMGMNYDIEAISINTENTPPKAVFTGPANIEVRHNIEEEKIMEQAIHSIVDTLKEPDGAEKIQNNPAGLIPAGIMPSHEERGNEEPSLKDIEQGMNMLKEMLSQ